MASIPLIASAAFLQFAGGVGKANAIRRQSLADADMDELYADQIIRNHFSNVQRQRDNLSRFTTQRMDQGGQQLGQVARAGDRAVGKVRTAVASSGAIAGEGTTQDVEVEQAFDAWYAQQQVATTTQADVESARIGYNQWMEADYEQSMMAYNRLYASARAKRSGAQDMWNANVLSSLFNAGGNAMMASA